MVEVFDALSSMRRSQPALNTSPELCTPYVKLKGLLDQPLLARASWPDKENTRYMVCTRGSILRVLELCRQIRDGVNIGQQPYQTRGYLLQSTGACFRLYFCDINSIWPLLFCKMSVPRKITNSRLKMSCKVAHVIGVNLSGLVTGRISMMWGKVWGTLDGISLAVFEDEDVSLFENKVSALNQGYK